MCVKDYLSIFSYKVPVLFSTAHLIVHYAEKNRVSIVQKRI